MAKKTRNILKGFFETGKKPTEGQYANLIDTLTDLYKLNIFVPPEIALRMHLTKYKTNAKLTEKLPAALLENSNNISLRVNYARTRGNKYLSQ